MGLVQYRNYADSNQIKKATNGNNEDFFLAMIRRPSMTDNGDGKKTESGDLDKGMWRYCYLRYEEAGKEEDLK